MKVLLVGPFETKGRYQGGIAYIVNSVLSNKQLYQAEGMVIKPFDTCRIERKMTDQGKMSLGNVKNTISIIKNLRHTAKEGKHDVIYYNSSYGMPLLKDLLSIKLSGCRKYAKVILHIHFADADKLLPSNRKLAALTLKLMKTVVNHVVFLSKKTAENFIKLGLEKKNVSVIYNFHNINMSDSDIQKKTKNLSQNKKRQLLFIGSIDQRKGILDLLEALKYVSFSYNLSICGKIIDDEIANKVNNAVRNLPKDSVEQKGFVSGNDKDYVLKNTDIMILPSYGEGFPIVLLEGIASGCAIVSTSVGAIPEVFNEQNGYIIPPGDIKKLKEGLNALSDIVRLGSVMKHNYNQSKQYGLNSFVKQMANVCEKVVYE